MLAHLCTPLKTICHSTQGNPPTAQMPKEEDFQMPHTASDFVGQSIPSTAEKRQGQQVTQMHIRVKALDIQRHPTLLALQVLNTRVEIEKLKEIFPLKVCGFLPWGTARKCT